jgi:hypothetical protein
VGLSFAEQSDGVVGGALYVSNAGASDRSNFVTDYDARLPSYLRYVTKTEPPMERQNP